MKKQFLVLICLAGFVANIFAQTQTFDIATFIPPQGWQQKDSNGVLLLHIYKTVNGATSFCQIFLFGSTVSFKNPAKNFTDEWNKRVVKITGTNQKPITSTEKTPDGWTAVTGYANLTQQGVNYTCILVTASGFGKVMSVMINIAGEGYKNDVNIFLDKMQLNAVKNNSSNPTGFLTDYIYTAPPGWSTTVYPDGIVLGSPVSNTGEKCNITLWPIRRASSSLQNDAVLLFNQVFKTFQVKQTYTPASMIKGISPQGWEYFIIKQGIAVPGGDYQTQFGFVFIAKLNNQVAAVSGISKDPLVSSCFGLQLTNVWPDFFYSLRFKNWNAIGKEETFKKRIAGTWMSVTGSAADRFAFAPNGRYAGTSAAQKYFRISSTEILLVTDAFFGDGAFSITGNSIQLTPDNNKSNTENGLIRIEQESNNSGRTWTEKLYLLRRSKVDNSLYEVVYEKQIN